MEFSIINELYKEVPVTVVAAMLSVPSAVPLYSSPCGFRINTFSYNYGGDVLFSFDIEDIFDENSHKTSYAVAYSPEEKRLSVSTEGNILTALDPVIAEYIYTSALVIIRSVASIMTSTEMVPRQDPKSMIHKDIVLAMLDAIRNGIGKLAIEPMENIFVSKTINSYEGIDEYNFTDCHCGKVSVWSYSPEKYFRNDYRKARYGRYVHVNLVKRILGTCTYLLTKL